jgi:putative ABC transport system permease protein
MKFRDVIRTTFSNLTRHKVRTALTTVGVVVGILTIVTMVSLGNGVHSEMRQAFASVGLETLTLSPVTKEVGAYDLFGQPERTRLLTDELVHQLQTREDVVEAIPYLDLPYTMRTTLRLGDQETLANLRGPGPSSVGDPFAAPPKTLAGVEEPPAEGGSAVFDKDILTQLGYDEERLADLVGQEVEVVLYAPRGESQVFRLRVAGVIEQQWGDVILALPDRLALLEGWYNDPDYLAHRGYDSIFVRARSLNEATHIVDWLSGLGYEVQSLKMILDMANRGMIIVKTMLGSVGGLALFVASIGIANTMVMAVYERTKEIGILKAVGAAPGQIRALFVVEASLIGLLGGVVGVILGWLLGRFINWLILAIMRWQQVEVQGNYFVVSWWLVAGALAFATLVGLLAGLYPAARAARLDPLDALRYE